jgi:hypothetical protein
MADSNQSQVEAPSEIPPASMSEFGSAIPSGGRIAIASSLVETAQVMSVSGYGESGKKTRYYISPRSQIQPIDVIASDGIKAQLKGIIYSAGVGTGDVAHAGSGSRR